MGELGRLFVRIDPQTGEFEKGIDSAEKKTKQFSLKSAAAIGVFAVAAIAAFRKISAAVQQSIQLYGRQVEAEVSLQAAVRASGQEVDRVFPKYMDLASEIQELTIIGDEAALEMIALATSMGVTEDQMEETIKGAIGLSDAFGIGTQQALRGVTLALEGNFEQLSRYIPALRTAETEAEKLAIVQQAMAGGFEVSQAKADTAFGAIQQYGNAVGDLQEQLGQTVAEGIEPFVRMLTSFAQRATAAASNTRELRDIIKSLEDTGQSGATSVEQLTQVIEELEAQEKRALVQFMQRDQATARRIQLLKQERLELAQLEFLQARTGDADEMRAARRRVADAEEDLANERKEQLLLDINRIRFESLSREEQELELVQQRINALVEERDGIDGTTEAHRDQFAAISQLIDILAAQRNELQGMLSDTEDVTTEWQTLGEAGVKTSGIMSAGFRTIGVETEGASESLEKYQAAVTQFADVFSETVGPVLEDIGAALVESEQGWVNMGRTAVKAIAQIIRAYAALWAAEAVAKIFSAPPDAAAKAAGSAAAFVAAGVVDALADKIQGAALGADFVTSGPQLLMVGDNPGGRERVSVEPLSSPNVSGPGGDMHVQIILDGQVISRFVTKAIKNNRILVDARAVI